MPPIYLDHNATSPLDPEVLEAMRPYWLMVGNPESRHSAGRAARRAWEGAKDCVARVLGAEPDEVVFTSGGTEANNLAIFGLAHQEQAEPRHIVSSPLEHPAVAGPISVLEASGFLITRPDVSREGLANAEWMAQACRRETFLTTLILAHNETGALQPVQKLASVARARGVAMHTDAVQAVGRIPVNFHELGVDTLAASARKFHGPVGVGILLVRRGVKLTPELHGGGQQHGRRPGTPAVALAVGLASALEKWQREADERIQRWTFLRDRLETGLITALGSGTVVRNGPANTADRLPQTLHVAFPGLDGDALLMQLDLSGIAASLGAACASGTTQPSPSLIAMSLSDDRLRSSVRFSLGATTTQDGIDEAIQRITCALRKIGPPITS